MKSGNQLYLEAAVVAGSALKPNDPFERFAMGLHNSMTAISESMGTFTERLKPVIRELGRIEARRREAAILLALTPRERERIRRTLHG